MSSGVIGFTIGFFVGGFFGVMALALLVAGDDRRYK